MDEARRGSRPCGVKDGVWSNAWVNSEAGLGWEREPLKDETGHWLEDERPGWRDRLRALTSMEQPSREPRSSALRMIW